MSNRWLEEIDRSSRRMDLGETYAQTWPHEHLVKERVGEAMFLDIVRRELWPCLVFCGRQDTKLYMGFVRKGGILWEN